MAITASMVKELRERTGAGMMECKRALVETGGDLDAAIEGALLHALLDISRRYNVESLQASCMEGGAWCTILKRLGFAAREQLTGPVVYSPKNTKWADILTKGENWWMTDGDRDG